MAIEATFRFTVLCSSTLTTYLYVFHNSYLYYTTLTPRLLLVLFNTYIYSTQQHIHVLYYSYLSSTTLYLLVVFFHPLVQCFSILVRVSYLTQSQD